MGQSHGRRVRLVVSVNGADEPGYRNVGICVVVLRELAVNISVWICLVPRVSHERDPGRKRRAFAGVEHLARSVFVEACVKPAIVRDDCRWRIDGKGVSLLADSVGSEVSICPTLIGPECRPLDLRRGRRCHGCDAVRFY